MAKIVTTKLRADLILKAYFNGGWKRMNCAYDIYFGGKLDAINDRPTMV